MKDSSIFNPVRDISGENIADGSVTEEKLSAELLTKVNSHIKERTVSVEGEGFTASVTKIHAVDTTGGEVIAELPAEPEAGDLIIFLDYAGTFGVNSLKVDGNGGKIKGLEEVYELDQSGVGRTFRYVDEVVGWLPL